jgi:hypothetical protein
LAPMASVNKSLLFPLQGANRPEVW